VPLVARFFRAIMTNMMSPAAAMSSTAAIIGTTMRMIFELEPERPTTCEEERINGGYKRV
jgi:hypothetical protein